MCGIATFTIDVSISSSTAARVTAMAMRYLYRYLSSAALAGTVPIVSVELMTKGAGC